ncbi:class I SAM-dependent methyltransferase, partial [Candidatus Bipolaricaulota bacterium]
VVAVDMSRRELEEAPDGPLKVVADARDLPFLDRTFDTATAFYTLMYLKSRSDCAKVLSEVYRVLRREGRLLIWESTVVRPEDTDKPGYVLFLRVRVKGQEIHTGYGQLWPERRTMWRFSRALPWRLDSRSSHRPRRIGCSSSSCGSPSPVRYAAGVASSTKFIN